MEFPDHAFMFMSWCIPIFNIEHEKIGCMYRMDYDDLADVSNWAFEAVSWMNMKEIYVLRDEDLLDPREKATRAETAMFLRR